MVIKTLIVELEFCEFQAKLLTKGKNQDSAIYAI